MAYELLFAHEPLANNRYDTLSVDDSWGRNGSRKFALQVRSFSSSFSVSSKRRIKGIDAR